MTHRWATIVGCVVLAAVAAACGKKGPPLPPLRPVPARIVDMSAVRTDDQIELRFTVPATNVDGSTPVVIDRVDIFAVAGEPDAPPPTAGQVTSAANLRRSLPVRRPPPEGQSAPTPVSTVIPAPGDVATFVDRVAQSDLGEAAALYYVAVPVAGTGRGRPGPPTAVARVPLGPAPEPPVELVLTHDENSLRGTWQPSSEGQVFYVYRGSQGSEDERVTAEPLSANEVSLPVEFGRETCLRVRALQVAGSVIVQGPLSAPACMTPVDQYPPPAPSGLRVVQEGDAITVMWQAVDAADLGGYVVLRGQGGDTASLEPLFQVPIRETTYRDTSVQAGGTYVYAVYAVDTAAAPNVSAPSPREAVIVR